MSTAIVVPVKDSIQRIRDLTRVKELLREADLVLVRRSIDDRPLPDRVLTLAFYLFTWILGLRYRDIQAGVKGFRRELILNAYHFLPRGFLGDLVLVYYAVKSGFRVEEVPVRWLIRGVGARGYIFSSKSPSSSSKSSPLS